MADAPERLDPLDTALTAALVELMVRADELREEAGGGSVNLASLVGETRTNIKALCSGELEPRAFMAQLDAEEYE